MIGLLSFIIGGVLMWAHYHFIGVFVFKPLTVWQTWFLFTGVGSIVDCLKTKDKQLFLCWLIIFSTWPIAMLAWKISPHYIVDMTLKNLIVMALLLMVSICPETALSALLHGVVVLAAYLTSINVIPSASLRPRVFLAFTYPDVAAALQHLSLIILGGYGLARNRLLDWRIGRRLLPAGYSAHGVAQKTKT